ncbi:MAG: hypothetical protein ACK2UW_01475 [Anaerolineales bacterium]
MIIENLIKYLLMGVVFTAVGFGFLLVGAHRTDITCEQVDPPNTRCTVQSSWLGHFRQPPRSAYPVEQAAVSDSCDSDGCTYRVELLTPFETVPVTYAYSSGIDAKARTADQINAYLAQDGGQPLQLHTDLDMGWFILVPILFVLIGLADLAILAGRVIVRLLGWRTA